MNRRRGLQSIGILALSVSLAGCSLGLFSDGRDQAVLKQRPHRPIGTDCVGINSGQRGLTVTQFRGLLSCLGSNGALGPIQKLVDPLPDTELEPLVRTLDEQFFSQPEVLRQIQQTHAQWGAAGRRGRELEAMGVLLREDQLLPALLRVSSHADDRFYSALALIAREGPGLSPVLDALISFLDSPALISLARRLEGTKLPGAGTFLHAALHASLSRGLDRALVASVADGSLFRALDTFAAERGVLGETARLKALIADLTGSRSPGILGLSQLVETLRRPISCLSGSRTMQAPLDFVLDGLSGLRDDEVEQLLRRQSVLQVAIAGSICTYPAELQSHYPAFQELASSELLFVGTSLSSALHDQGISALLMDSMEGPLPELAPVLSHLAENDALGDFLLLFSLIPERSRVGLRSAAASLLRPRAELSGASLLEAIRQPMTHLTVEDLEALVGAVGKLLDSPEAKLKPALEALRSVFHMNRAHPFSGSFTHVLTRPERSSAVFRMLGRWSSEREADFRDALGFLGEMTLQSDGRFNDILSSLLRVFAKYASQGEPARPLPVLDVPVLNAAGMRAHSWSSANLKDFMPARLRRRSACDALHPGVRLDWFDTPSGAASLRSFVECLGDDPAAAPLRENVFDWLLARRSREGSPLLGQMIGQLHALGLNPEASRELLGSGSALLVDLLAPLSDRTFSNALSQVISKIVDGSGESFERLERLAGRLLRNGSVGEALAAFEEAALADSASSAFEDREEFDLAAFGPVLGRYECIQDEGARRRRAEDLADDYRHGVVNWRLDSYSMRPPRHWSDERLREDLLPLIQKLSSPAHGPLIEGLTRFMSRFRDPSRLSELKDWLAVRVNDWRVIPYFHPDEQQPRARMVNSLDLLELLVINSDFNFVLPENYALKFLTSVALAWGDEPRDSWPALVRSMYPHGKRPPTLREAYSEILETLELSEKWIGYPRLPDCRGGFSRTGVLPHWLKARVFNMRQSVVVISEALPGAPGSRSGGLKLLRELLFDMYQSTPEDHRGTSEGWSNNLSAGVQMAKLGAFRQIGRGARLALLPGNETALLGSVISGLAEASSVPSTPRLLRALLAGGSPREGAGELVLSLMGRAETVLDDPSRAPQFRNSILRALSLLASPGLAPPVIRALESTVVRARGDLARVAPGAIELLGSERVSAFLEALSESLQERGRGEALAEAASIALGESAPGVPASVDLLRILAEAASPELEESWRELLQAPGLAGVRPNLIGLLRRSAGVRQYLADRCERNELSSYLKALAADPAGAARLFESVGKTSVSGGLDRLVSDFLRALPDPRP
jgi:hypothetical protein